MSPSREACTSSRCREGSPVASARLVPLIQARQLETPLSTVDSSEGVGPKAAHTLDSVERGYKTPALLILHLCERNLLDLNQNFMSQLSGLTQMDGNDEHRQTCKWVNFTFDRSYFDLLQLESATKNQKNSSSFAYLPLPSHPSMNDKCDMKAPR